ncbi:MAG: hypothetical protein ABL308_05860 [Oceanicaulis sp.]
MTQRLPGLPGLPGLPDVTPSRGTPTVQQANPSAGDAMGSAFSALAQASRDMRRELQPMLDDRARRKAREDYQAASDEAEEDAPISPAMRRVISRQDAVYNQTLQQLTQARAMNQAERSLADLRREHAYQPDQFRAAARQWRDRYLRGVDSAFKPELELAMNAQIDDLELAVIDERRANDTSEARQALELRLENVDARITSGFAEQGPDFATTAAFREAQAEAQDVISILVESPQYEWSAEQGAAALDGLASSGRESLVYHEVDAVLRTEGEAAALAFVEDFLAGQELSPNDRIAQRSRLINRVANTQRRLDLIAAERNREDARARAVAESEARGLLNAVTRARAEGQPVDPLQVDALQRYADAGLISASEFRTTVNALNASASDNEVDQGLLASLYDEARDLAVPVEDLERMTLAAVGAGSITAANREAILSQALELREDGMERGVDAIKATFERGWMDGATDRQALATAEDAAMNDLIDWRRRNPDAPSYEVRQAAIRFAALRGREIPPPSAPLIEAAGAPPGAHEGGQAFAAWRERAEIAIEELALEPGAPLDQQRQAVRLQNELDAYEAWHARQRAALEALQTTPAN